MKLKTQTGTYLLFFVVWWRLAVDVFDVVALVVFSMMKHSEKPIFNIKHTVIPMSDYSSFPCEQSLLHLLFSHVQGEGQGGGQVPVVM